MKSDNKRAMDFKVAENALRLHDERISRFHDRVIHIARLMAKADPLMAKADPLRRCDGHDKGHWWPPKDNPYDPVRVVRYDAEDGLWELRVPGSYENCFYQIPSEWLTAADGEVEALLETKLRERAATEAAKARREAEIKDAKERDQYNRLCQKFGKTP